MYVHDDRKREFEIFHVVFETFFNENLVFVNVRKFSQPSLELETLTEARLEIIIIMNESVEASKLIRLNILILIVIAIIRIAIVIIISITIVDSITMKNSENNTM